MIANLIAETFKGISTLVAQKPWKINKMHYIISLNHLQFSKRTDTYASLDFSFFFFYLSRNRREEKLQCGLVLFGLLTATGKKNLHWAFFDGVKHSFILEWEAGKKTRRLVIWETLFTFFQLHDFRICWMRRGTTARPLTRVNFGGELDISVVHELRIRFGCGVFHPSTETRFFPTLLHPPSSKGNTCHGTWKGRCLGVRTSVGLPQRAQLQQMIGSADDQR